jgi:hypothetical protein
LRAFLFPVFFASRIGWVITPALPPAGERTYLYVLD